MAISRAFHIPGILFLFVSFLLLFLVSIGLPFLTALDFVRVHFKDGLPTVGSDTTAINQIRLGTWAACWYETDGDRGCSAAHNAYATTIYDAQRQGFVHIAPSWTRGLAIHPVATAVTLVALVLSFSTHVTARLLASLAAFLAAFLTLVAFLCDIALYAWVKHQVGKLSNVGSNTDTAPGFWITFVCFLLLTFAGCTVCFGRRRDRLDGATTYSYSWRDRFRIGRKSAV
ncbi:hypothetical protein DICSQDRAFT_175390 [Dichomitus squalens LYAD-421 SS1]|uniref:Pali-domain-containing protein n=1 Tax=Dichomitus squalens (strain LYAD-421) TaxID=732165 RepID=R7SID7_DICSQ|nr:uncharacterized protein DICSQDRAFT_175390 [Dichomitus squalens LYAD-421 SS1]EJF55914.1 hypothetical protein DICSQDRAFT_175390 [Dichomitus squalens LYAD-421 SS1]